MQTEKPKWWTVDSNVLVGLGVVMAVTLGLSFVARHGSRSGSDLVPAATLQRLIEKGGECQTVTDDDIYSKAPPRRC